MGNPSDKPEKSKQSKGQRRPRPQPKLKMVIKNLPEGEVELPDAIIEWVVDALDRSMRANGLLPPLQK